jgi:hypothetical protein
MPLGIYLDTPQGRRKSATLPTNFDLNDFRNLIEQKVGNPEQYDYSLGDIIFRTWNEEVFNRQRSAIHDGVTVIIQYPPIGPPWRQASIGLCLEGVCLNVQCDAFEQKVVMNQGLGKFNVVINSKAITSKCPSCGESVLPSTCAFYHCSWQLSGIKHDDSNKNSSLTWQNATNNYHRWEHSLTSWSQLTIETKK